MAPFIFWNLAFYTIIRTQLWNGQELFLTVPFFYDLLQFVLVAGNGKIEKIRYRKFEFSVKEGISPSIWN